jgi:hypothetical protein
MKRILRVAAVLALLVIFGIALNGKLSTSSCCGETISPEEVVALKLAAQHGDIDATWKLQEDAANRGAAEESLEYLRHLRTYKLAYKRSKTSGRSLLVSVEGVLIMPSPKRRLLAQDGV